MTEPVASPERTCNARSVDEGHWKDEGRRSKYVRKLLCRPVDGVAQPQRTATIPAVVIQYWHDGDGIPADVEACMSSWKPLHNRGVSRRLFDDRSARALIADALTKSHVVAFDRCHHPAMRCDYFRLCYLHCFGGLYVDADDRMLSDASRLFEGASLKIRPLCYDLSSNEMVAVEDAIRDESRFDERIFYFNNNPLAAPAGHPVVSAALQRATEILLGGGTAIADIQSTTGPGNLTACVVRYDLTRPADERGLDVEILLDWDEVAESVWPLSYRNDDRNWRNWRPTPNHLASDGEPPGRFR